MSSHGARDKVVRLTHRPEVGSLSVELLAISLACRLRKRLQVHLPEVAGLHAALLVGVQRRRQRHRSRLPPLDHQRPHLQRMHSRQQIFHDTTSFVTPLVTVDCQ